MENQKNPCNLQIIGYNAPQKGKQIEMTEPLKCEDCEYSRPLNGLGAPVLICSRKKAAHRQWWAVQASATCTNFKRSRELVPPDLAAALAEGAKLIPLTRGRFAIVDAEDYEWLNQYKWHVSKSGCSEYAVRCQGRKHISMHRLLLNAPPGLLVDHRDCNGLNNRKANLRLCTHLENIRNQRPRKDGTSRFKGVSRRKTRKKYTATIHKDGKRYSLGYFRDEIEAAVVYDIKAMELFGEFAYLNFPKLMQRFKLVNHLATEPAE